MKIERFEMEESKVNKGRMCLIAIAEDGSKHVINGGSDALVYLDPYETSWDTKDNNPYAYKKTANR